MSRNLYKASDYLPTLTIIINIKHRKVNKTLEKFSKCKTLLIALMSTKDTKYFAEVPCIIFLFTQKLFNNYMVYYILR